VRLLILGSGGREHALAWRLSRDSDVGDVLAAPGNPGMGEIGRCVPVDINAPDDVLALVEKEAVDLTVVGPEAALERGVVDRLRDAGHAIVGPTARAAALECSKAWAKQFMARHNVPTARFAVCDTLDRALAAVSGHDFGFPVVVKADGLAAGKGVIIAESRAEAESAARAAMADRRFGDAGSTLVIEECLTGPEVSFFALVDGDRALPLGSAQDHKRIFDDDRGPNTGGMGAFAPSPLATRDLVDDVMARVVDPVVAGMRAEGKPYTGFLYTSLMLTPDGPKVIEFNVRFGDPEAQVVLPAVEGRFALALRSSATGGFDAEALTISEDRLVGVVIAAPGYPGSPQTGQAIEGFEQASRRPDTMVFHAGTKVIDDRLVTSGGRVLTVVGRGPSFAAAMARAYDAVADIRFEGMQYRRDIGRKALV
jgi:phosphoribosylamine--glycine ligase